jgi:hypothetical protein
MSTRYENHRHAAELHDAAAHAHRVAAEHHGKQDHLSGHEQTRQALEHSRIAHEHTTTGARHSFGHDQIAARAHAIWEANGRPEGTADQDWFRAAEELRAGR